MNYPPKTFDRRPAFTLIELLVMVAIIAVLAALLMPALRSMQQKAGATKCLANMKTIGAGVALFTAEHDGQFPRGGWSDTGAVLDPPVPGGTLPWLADIYPYVGRNRDVFVCPNAPKVGPNGEAAWVTMPGSGWNDERYPMHYGYNAQLNTLREGFRVNIPPLYVDRLQSVQTRSGLPVLIEQVFQNNFYGFDSMWSKNPAPTDLTAFATRHVDKGNVLWGDGRVTQLTREEWATMPEKKVSPGGWRYWLFCIGDY